MAVELPRDDETADTSTHATISEVGAIGDKRDTLYVPGTGIFLSRSAISGLESSAQKTTGLPRFEEYQRALIDEATIEHWYAMIQAQKKLDDSREARRKEYEAQCYPGTDTEDPSKSKYQIPGKEKANAFEIDRSRSRISLCVTSGSRYLNGSAVPHSHYIHIKVNSPDGREIVDVAMTFDQFSSFLVSNMETPCTVDRYWSVNDKCVRLREIVKEPASIKDRMKQRLGDRINKVNEELDAIRQTLEEQVTTGKAMSKTKLEELAKQLKWFQERMNSNRDFTILQAQEEITSVVEQAACSIAWEHRLTKDELATSTPLRALAESWTPKLALPPAPNAPEPTGTVSGDS